LWWTCDEFMDMNFWNLKQIFKYSMFFSVQKWFWQKKIKNVKVIFVFNHYFMLFKFFGNLILKNEIKKNSAILFREWQNFHYLKWDSTLKNLESCILEFQINEYSFGLDINKFFSLFCILLAGRWMIFRQKLLHYCSLD